MSSRKVRHLEVREVLAERISSGELRTGDRLPSERDLQKEFEYSRSVIRQALAALTSDGWIEPNYPRGYVVLGPRIPWLGRLRLLSEEEWAAHIGRAERGFASEDVAQDLSIQPGDPVAIRPLLIFGDSTGEKFGTGATYHPLDTLSERAARALLTRAEITTTARTAYSPSWVLGYRERISARLPSRAESDDLGIAQQDPILEMRRVDRTTTTPTQVLVFIGRSDRFQADYLIRA